MDWHDDVTAALPDPEVPEPPSLRRDLVDEIADHLHEALGRELRADVEGTEESARARVLERFGDTRSVLRQLWFDALKERLVSQRITLAAVVVLAVASLAICGLTWSAARGFQEANRQLLTASEEANRALLAESREANEKLLALLAAREAEAAKPAPSLEWNHLVMQLVPDSGEEPLVGWKASLKGHLHTVAETNTLQESSDASGRIDFGMVRPGQHQLIVNAPWDEQTSRSVTVRPGEENVVRIDCPTAASPMRDVELDFEILGVDRIRAADMGLVAEIRRASREVGSLNWWPSKRYALLLSPDGAMLRVGESFSESKLSSTSSLALVGVGERLEGNRLSLPTGSLFVESLHFVRLPKDRTLSGNMVVDVVPPTRTHMGFVDDITQAVIGARNRPDDYPLKFELAKGDGPDRWTIDVPDDLCAYAFSNTQISDSDRQFIPIAMATVWFHRMDADSDGLVTREEYDAGIAAYDPKYAATDNERPSDLAKAEWPLTENQYVENPRVLRGQSLRVR